MTRRSGRSLKPPYTDLDGRGGTGVIERENFIYCEPTRTLPPQSNSLRPPQNTLVCRSMREDSRAPRRGAGGSRCNTEVWQ
jgi:hypothetical protein